MYNNFLSKDASSSKLWDQYYLDNDTGWDLGGITPAFRDWCDKLSIKSKIFVPGSGNGYDPLYFAIKGHDVLAVDFAKVPIQRMKREAKKNNLNLEILNCDLFNLNKKYHQSFDYIVEYTCFCAINPDQRNQYIDTMYDLLKKNGEFIGFFFPLNKKESEGGPPFSIDLNESIKNQYY